MGAPPVKRLTDAVVTAVRTLDLHDLLTFVVTAEERSLSRAAERLHGDRSAPSRALTRVEKICGTALFDRTTRSMRLTEAGRRLLPYAQDVIDAAERLVRNTPRSTAATAGRPATAGAVLLDEAPAPPEDNGTIVLP